MNAPSSPRRAPDLHAFRAAGTAGLDALPCTFSQALEAATPATLARRSGARPPRHSLVAAGTLLDMER